MFTFDVSNGIRKILLGVYSAVLNPIPYLATFAVAITSLIAKYVTQCDTLWNSSLFERLRFEWTFAGNDFMSFFGYICSLDLACIMVQWFLIGVSVFVLFVVTSLVLFFAAAWIYRSVITVRTATTALIPK